MILMKLILILMLREEDKVNQDKMRMMMIIEDMDKVKEFNVINNDLKF
jgi:hypothetical protein